MKNKTWQKRKISNDNKMKIQSLKKNNHNKNTTTPQKK